MVKKGRHDAGLIDRTTVFDERVLISIRYWSLPTAVKFYFTNNIFAKPKLSVVIYHPPYYCCQFTLLIFRWAISEIKLCKVHFFFILLVYVVFVLISRPIFELLFLECDNELEFTSTVRNSSNVEPFSCESRLFLVTLLPLDDYSLLLDSKVKLQWCLHYDSCHDERFRMGLGSLDLCK